MIELLRTPPGLRIKQIWFADRPFDVEDCDEVHFIHCKDDVKLDGFKQTPQGTIIIDLSKGEDHVWSSMNRTNRHAINKAQKEGIKIRRNQDYAEYIELNNKFRELKKLMPVSFPLDFIKNKCLLLTAELNGEIISGNLLPMDGTHMLWLLGASKRLDADKQLATQISMANRLLVWEAIQYGLENGVTSLDMGGYVEGADPSSSEGGVNDFKSRFGGEIVHYFNYQKEYSLKVKVGRVAMRSLGRLGYGLYKKDW